MKILILATLALAFAAATASDFAVADQMEGFDPSLVHDPNGILDCLKAMQNKLLPDFGYVAYDFENFKTGDETKFYNDAHKAIDDGAALADVCSGIV